MRDHWSFYFISVRLYILLITAGSQSELRINRLKMLHCKYQVPQLFGPTITYMVCTWLESILSWWPISVVRIAPPIKFFFTQFTCNSLVPCSFKKKNTLLTKQLKGFPHNYLEDVQFRHEWHNAVPCSYQFLDIITLLSPDLFCILPIEVNKSKSTQYLTAKGEEVLWWKPKSNRRLLGWI